MCMYQTCIHSKGTIKTWSGITIFLIYRHTECRNDRATNNMQKLCRKNVCIVTCFCSFMHGKAIVSRTLEIVGK